MKAIRVRFLGPTNTRGSRWKASVADGQDIASVTVSSDHSMSDPQLRALEALVTKLGWQRYAPWVEGVYGGDYYYISADWARKTSQSRDADSTALVGRAS